jgi:hypothetical protein
MTTLLVIHCFHIHGFVNEPVSTECEEMVMVMVMVMVTVMVMMMMMMIWIII